VAGQFRPCAEVTRGGNGCDLNEKLESVFTSGNIFNVPPTFLLYYFISAINKIGTLFLECKPYLFLTLPNVIYNLKINELSEVIYFENVVYLPF